jgi:sulfur carrier protein ThiS
MDQGATLADLLLELEITQKVVVSVNDIQVTDYSHQLLNGDEVKLFSSISGG